VICPKCGAEYVTGFTHCSDCLVPLVDSLPKPEPELEPGPESAPAPEIITQTKLVDPVCVFRSGHLGRIAVAKSILQSADVPFVVLNEVTQNLIAMGNFPYGFNIALGGVQIMVSRTDAEDARAMVCDLEGFRASTNEDEGEAQA